MSEKNQYDDSKVHSNNAQSLMQYFM